MIVGCLSYRGYFSWRDANNYAEKLEQQGLDTYIGGVAAYSTLGWFRDPVLNTMLNRDDPYLAKLIFHELAHQKLYIEDDTEFNEAFAEAVGFIGTKMWLQDQGHEIKTIFTNKNRREKQFYDLVLGVRNSLNKIYDSSIPDQEKRNLKQETIAKLRDEYSELRNQWNNNTDYDSWFNNDINNAKLAAVSTYRLLVPEFISLYEKTGNDLDLLYSLIDQLKTCDKKTRYTMLRQKSLKVIC